MQEKKQKADVVEGERAAAPLPGIPDCSGPAGETGAVAANVDMPSKKLSREEKARQRKAAACEREIAQQRQATMRCFSAHPLQHLPRCTTQGRDDHDREHVAVQRIMHVLAGLMNALAVAAGG